MIDTRATTLFAALLMMTVGSPSWALEAETADQVSGYTISVPSNARIDEDDGTVFVGKSDCEAMLDSSRVSVVFATRFNPQVESNLIDQIDIFNVGRESRARINCSSGELCLPIDPDDYNFTTSGVSIDIAFSFLLQAGEFTTCEEFDQEFFVRLSVEDGVPGSGVIENADAKIVVDTIRPSAPGGLAANATQSTIAVSFEASADSDVNRYFIYWSSSPFDGGQSPDGLSLERRPIGLNTSGNVSATVDPTKPLYIAVVAEDLAGNLSDLSGVVEASVQKTNDFWEQYKQAGGEEDGGCSTTTGHASPWLLLLGLGLFGVRRRRRRGPRPLATAALLATVLLLAPVNASAESEIWGTFDIKFGGYYPAIDEEFGDSGPFGDVFGTKNLLLGELELAGWLWQGFGKFGIAGHIAYSRVKGGAVVSDDAASAAEDELEIEDTTAFTVIPLRLSAVYRFDYLAQHTQIPLSFSVKAGPDFYRWRITNASRTTASFDGDPGAGWKKGWHLAGGMQLLLDVIDPSTAAAFDLTWGVNNSYFFVEFMMTKIDDFGGTGFDLSDNLWLFGLSFEF